MEDIIYIILLVVWVVFAFYRQSQKNKAKKSQGQPAQEQDGAEHYKESSDVASLIEDLLTGQQSSRAVPKPAEFYVEDEQDDFIYEDPVEEVETISFEEEYVDKGISSVEESDWKAVLARLESRQFTEQISEDKTDLEEVQKKASKFDLRQAVIFSEILNRPYV